MKTFRDILQEGSITESVEAIALKNSSYSGFSKIGRKINNKFTPKFMTSAKKFVINTEKIVEQQFSAIEGERKYVSVPHNFKEHISAMLILKTLLKKYPRGIDLSIFSYHTQGMMSNSLDVFIVNDIVSMDEIRKMEKTDLGVKAVEVYKNEAEDNRAVPSYIGIKIPMEVWTVTDRVVGIYSKLKEMALDLFPDKVGNSHLVPYTPKKLTREQRAMAAKATTPEGMIDLEKLMNEVIKSVM